MTTDTIEPARDLKADPTPCRIGTHVLFRVGPDDDHQEQRVVLVYKSTLRQPRWGLPGGTWGADPTETPVDTAARHLGVRLGCRSDSYPLVLGTDWVLADQYPPGMNVVLDGGTITATEAALMRPTPEGGYGEVKLMPVSKVFDADIPDPEKLRIIQALKVATSGRGFPMTVHGIPIPATAPRVR